MAKAIIIDDVPRVALEGLPIVVLDELERNHDLKCTVLALLGWFVVMMNELSIGQVDDVMLLIIYDALGYDYAKKHFSNPRANKRYALLLVERYARYDLSKLEDDQRQYILRYIAYMIWKNELPRFPTRKRVCRYVEDAMKWFAVNNRTWIGLLAAPNDWQKIYSRA